MDLARRPTGQHGLARRPRVVPLEGAFNFRDVGGFPAHGGTVRSRLVYRSDGLHRLSSGDLGRLRRLGIRTVVDLRSTQECDHFGVCPVEPLRAAYHHVPLVEEPWRPPGAQEPPSLWLASHYRALLDSSSDAIIAVLALLADSANWPVVFHCTGGKDRTGVVAAVLLALLGVSDADIVEDYCASTPGVTWLRQAYELAPNSPLPLSTMPAAIFEVPEAAMWRVLDSVMAAHGSMQAWAVHAGMPPSLIAALRAGLVG